MNHGSISTIERTLDTTGNIIIKEKNPSRVDTIDRFIMLLKKYIRLTTLVEYNIAVRNDLMKLRETSLAPYIAVISMAVIK